MFVVLLNEREAAAELWAPAEERIEQYTNLGAELFLHRPFGMMAYKECVEKALTWAKSPPAWVQLMRAARTLLKTQQAERVLTGLKTLHVRLPKDQNIGILYVKALQSCQVPKYNEAIEVLQTLLSSAPENPFLLRMAYDTYMALEQFEEAAKKGLKLCEVRPSPENAKLMLDLFAKLQLATKSSTLWSRLFSCVPNTALSQVRALRAEIAHHWARADHEAADVESFVRNLKNHPEIGDSLKEEFRELVERIESSSSDAKGPERSVAVPCLLEYILDARAGNEWALLKYVQIQVENGNLRAAESRLRRARIVNQFSFEYHLGMAIVALAQGEVEPAARFCDNAKRFTAGSESAKTTLANLMVEIEKATKGSQKAG
jgi:predicted Zn-dependent protease